MAEKKKNIPKNNLTPAKDVKAGILVPRLIFMLSVLVLLLLGFIMIFSASNVEALSQNENPYSYVLKQLLFSGVGVFFAVVIWRFIPYWWWSGKLTWFLFGGLVLLMIATLFAGTDILGAKRWLYFGPVSIQPSEYAKIALVLLVAKYYAEWRQGIISRDKCILVAGGLCGLMLGFILVAQSDLGTSIICLVGIMTLLWIADMPVKYIIVIVAIVVLVGICAISLKSYRSSRMVFLDPFNDGENGYGAGYQLIRSYYALAEGGLGGVGLGNSFEKYQYLPEAETDFIFSIVGEETGFFGCTIMIGAFFVFIVSGMYVALRSKDRFAASVSGSFVAMIGFQAFLNIFCVIGFAPTTGKPLPFISYGGSSILATLIMVGFVLAGSESDALPDRYERTRGRFTVEKPLKANNNSRLDSVADKPEPELDAPSGRKTTLRSSSSSLITAFKNTSMKPKGPKQKPARPGMPKLKKKENTQRIRPRSTGNTQSFVYKREHRSLGFKPQNANFGPVEENTPKRKSARTSSSKRKRR